MDFLSDVQAVEARTHARRDGSVRCGDAEPLSRRMFDPASSKVVEQFTGDSTTKPFEAT